MAEFDPETLLRLLSEHDVQCVIIGGMAGTIHGSPHVTFDLDITPSRDTENLVKLARLLVAIDARIRTEGVLGGLPFDRSAEFLANIELLNLSSKFGDLDIAFLPAGTDGYPDLVRSAVVVEIDGISATVAALEDVIRSKEAANRDKDRVVLPSLRAILTQRQDRSASLDCEPED